ncbi:MAG: hypothetical protein VX185_08000 [Pseudomonadota bacterium]|nr:hypothetical protein [Pseudomonadota bacterium]
MLEKVLTQADAFKISDQLRNTKINLAVKKSIIKSLVLPLKEYPQYIDLGLVGNDYIVAKARINESWNDIF